MKLVKSTYMILPKIKRGTLEGCYHIELDNGSCQTMNIHDIFNNLVSDLNFTKTTPILAAFTSLLSPIFTLELIDSSNFTNRVLFSIMWLLQPLSRNQISSQHCKEERQVKNKVSQLAPSSFSWFFSK